LQSGKDTEYNRMERSELVNKEMHCQQLAEEKVMYMSSRFAIRVRKRVGREVSMNRCSESRVREEDCIHASTGFMD